MSEDGEDGKGFCERGRDGGGGGSGSIKYKVAEDGCFSRMCRWRLSYRVNPFIAREQLGLGQKYV